MTEPIEGFRRGEEVDLLDFAERVPGYFSPQLVAALKAAREAPPQPFIVRVVSVTHPDDEEREP